MNFQKVKPHVQGFLQLKNNNFKKSINLIFIIIIILYYKKNIIFSKKWIKIKFGITKNKALMFLQIKQNCLIIH